MSNEEIEMIEDIAASTGCDVEALKSRYEVIENQREAFLLDLKDMASRGVPIFTALASVKEIPVEAVIKTYISFENVKAAFIRMTDKAGMFHNLRNRKSKTTEAFDLFVKDMNEILGK